MAADVEELLTYRALPDVCCYLPFAPMTREVLQGRLCRSRHRRPARLHNLVDYESCSGLLTYGVGFNSASQQPLTVQTQVIV